VKSKNALTWIVEIQPEVERRRKEHKGNSWSRKVLVFGKRSAVGKGELTHSGNFREKKNRGSDKRQVSSLLLRWREQLCRNWTGCPGRKGEKRRELITKRTAF